jgi:4'-phosphopantetheinyl transferase
MSGQDLRFSVSRSEGVAVIALSKFRDVGVDIEAVRRVPEADDIAALCFAPPEYDSYRALCEEEKPEGFLIRWTRMEAIAKALGCGLGRALPSDDRNLVVHTFVPQPGFIATIVQN